MDFFLPISNVDGKAGIHGRNITILIDLISEKIEIPNYPEVLQIFFRTHMLFKRCLFKTMTIEFKTVVFIFTDTMCTLNLAYKVFP